MKCKHAHIRNGYAVNIPRKTDAEVLAIANGHREPSSNEHYLQIWRQYHVTEARKRGLS